MIADCAFRIAKFEVTEFRNLRRSRGSAKGGSVSLGLISLRLKNQDLSKSTALDAMRLALTFHIKA